MELLESDAADFLVVPLLEGKQTLNVFGSESQIEVVSVLAIDLNRLVRQQDLRIKSEA